ncbi:flagellar basal body rod protein FlgB [Paraconexibacter sp.]|uniref:flagellar basal body rod protein FlgB n=1 Tax=Paraconexibacter sp. TaxID=2949640 RepID=UPI003568E777
MNLFDTTQLALDAAMHGASVRQSAIAQNVANVNTPGYRRQDVSFESQLGAALRANDRDALRSLSPAPAVDQAAPVRADGNSVDMDTEAAGQARNGLTYAALVAVYKARTTILQSAIGVR